jgi:DNA-binding HxlR family transcriptional regulator
MDHRPATHEGVRLSELMLRGQLFSVQCPSRDVLKHVTSRWGVLLLVALMQGTRRFSDLRRIVGGVSEKMLAQTLRWLEADGFVVRRSLGTVPPHVEYSLTPLGREVGARVQSLADWIEVSMPAILHAQQAQSPAGPDLPPGVTVHLSADREAGQGARDLRQGIRTRGPR